MAKKDTAQYSASKLKALRESGKTSTRRDAPLRDLDETFWRKARVVMPSGKTSVHLRVDTDVFEWFRTQGKGHLSRMNAVLRSYMEARRRG